MKTMIRSTVISTVIAFLIASPVGAASIVEWVFVGTTTSSPSGSPSEFNSVPFANDLSFEFRILLDSMGSHFSGPEFFFGAGPGAVLQGSVLIAGDALPVKVPIISVDYFTQCVSSVHCDETQSDFLGRFLTVVDLQIPNVPSVSKQGLPLTPPFAVLLTPLELGPLGPLAPMPGSPGAFSDDILEIVGPNGLHVFGKVTAFTAVVLPEGGSTLLFLASALVALAFLWRRYKGSAS